MSFLTLYSGLLGNTIRRLNAQFNIFQANEAQYGLASKVTGNESMGQILNIFNQDKALTLGRIKNQFAAQFAGAQETYYQQQLKKDFERRQENAKQGLLG